MPMINRTPTRRSQARQVPIHEDWLELIARRVDEWQEDRRDAGKPAGQRDLADLLGVSQPTVHRYLTGEATTDEVTTAFCRLFSLPYPVWSAASPAEAEWFAVGRELSELDPVRFLEALRWARDIVEARKKERRAKAALRAPRERDRE